MTKSQSEILQEVLDLNSEIEERQQQINSLVEENRKLPDEDKDKNFTESIDSYHL